MIRTLLILLLSSLSLGACAQKVNSLLRQGNKAYGQKQYDKATESYQKALDLQPGNAVGRYNLGDALYRNKKLNEAASSYDKVAKGSGDAAGKEKAYYNEGVSLQNQQKLPDCIEVYKKALELDPGDQDARYNLQRALRQQQQQQQQQQKNQPKPQKQPKNQQQKNPQQNQQQNQQQQPQSKLTRQQAEQLLQAIQQREKELQDKMQKARTSPTQPDKDW